MAAPTFTMRQLLEAGVHFGHTTRRWNPKMKPFIFGERNGVHILDLEQTVPMLHQALGFVRGVVAGGGRVLFVGTKRQASDQIAEAAKKCGQYYVNHRWLGGMLTNWKTISNSIKRLRDVEERLVEETLGLTKKEMLKLTRERDKLERALGGIKEMGDRPDVLFVIDTNKEHIAVAEAAKLGIPVVAVVDSNSNPVGIPYPVPGNDDALRAIALYCDLIADAVLDGIQAELISTGTDVGEAEEAPVEPSLENAGEAPAAAPAEAAAAPVEATAAPVEQAAAPAEAAAAPVEATAAPVEQAAAPAEAAAAPVEATAAPVEQAAAPAEAAAAPAEAAAAPAEAAAAPAEAAAAPAEAAAAPAEAAAAPAEAAAAPVEQAAAPAEVVAASKKPKPDEAVAEAPAEESADSPAEA